MSAAAATVWALVDTLGKQLAYQSGDPVLAELGASPSAVVSTSGRTQSSVSGAERPKHDIRGDAIEPVSPHAC